MLLERAIYEVVEHELEETAPDYWPMRKAGKLAFMFSRWLDSLRKDTAKVGVITSNYDLAIEQAWGFYWDTLPAIEKLGVDLGFPWLWASNGSERMVARPSRPKRRLYKLHGSTNWMKCRLCDRYTSIRAQILRSIPFSETWMTITAVIAGMLHLMLQLFHLLSFVTVAPATCRECGSQLWIGLREADDWIVIGIFVP